MKKIVMLILMITGLANAQNVQRFAFSVTRPANNTAYAAGDVVCGTDSKPFRLVPEDAVLSSEIRGIRIAFDSRNTTNASFRLFLYSDSTGLGEIADNSAHVYDYTLDSLLIGWVDFTLSTEGSSVGFLAWAGIAGDSPFYFKSNVRDGRTQGVWGRLVALAAYEPKYQGKIRIVTTIAESQ